MMDDFIHSTCSIPWGCQDSDETKTASANSSPGPQALHQNQPALQSLRSLPWETRWCTGERSYRNSYVARWALKELETVSSKTYWNCKDALSNLAKLVSDSAVKPPNKQIPTILFFPAPSVFQQKQQWCFRLRVLLCKGNLCHSGATGMKNSFCKQKRKKAAVTCSVTPMKSHAGITASVVSCQRPSVASRLKLSSWKKMQTSLMGDCIILSLAFNQMKLVPWTDRENKGPHSFVFFFFFSLKENHYFLAVDVFSKWREK